jgi:hypothetical protein
MEVLKDHYVEMKLKRRIWRSWEKWDFTEINGKECSDFKDKNARVRLVIRLDFLSELLWFHLKS